MKNTQLMVWLFLGIVSKSKAPGTPPNQGFYVITNQPSRGRNSGDLYLYAIDTRKIAATEEIEFEKAESGLPGNTVQTGEIRTSATDLWGCYLKVGQRNSKKGLRFGTYTVTDSERSINTFVRPSSRFLNTRGVYTVTVFPESEGSTDLADSDDNPIGVAWTSGCQNIRWCKGKRRNINTGPRLTLTSKEDAGIYTIQRRNRGKRFWFAQIEVIVASCPMGQYGPTGSCSTRVISMDCKNGGVPKDEIDECTCPPFFTTDDCSLRAEVPYEFFGLGYGSQDLLCSGLDGGNTKCKGYLYCPGDLFGCTCFPGWFGNNCDKSCSKGSWGIGCSQDCPDDNKQCNRFDGSDTPE